MERKRKSLTADDVSAPAADEADGGRAAVEARLAATQACSSSAPCGAATTPRCPPPTCAQLPL